MRESINHPSVRCMDRAMLLGGPQLLSSIDDVVNTTDGVQMGLGIAKNLAGAARSHEGIKRLMDGGLLFYIKMDCALRQKRQKDLEKAIVGG